MNKKSKLKLFQFWTVHDVNRCNNIYMSSQQHNDFTLALACLHIVLVVCPLCPFPLLLAHPCLTPRGWQSCVASGRPTLTQPWRPWVVSTRSHPKVWHSSWRTARPNSVALNSNCECVCVKENLRRTFKEVVIKVNMKNVQMILSQFTLHTVSCYQSWVRNKSDTHCCNLIHTVYSL